MDTNHYSIVVARKPLSEKSIVENVLKWGTGGINIDGSRIEMKDKDNIDFEQIQNQSPKTNNFGGFDNRPVVKKMYKEEGRFPANIIFDEEAGKILDQQSGISKSRNKYPELSKQNMPMNYWDGIKEEHIKGKEQTKDGYEDIGGASRFFYCPKDEDDDYEIKTNNMNIDLRLGDCIEVLKTLPDNSVDSIVTDPPYGLGFMNKEWDSPEKLRELTQREEERSAQRKAEGKSPTTASFSKSVPPGLAIKGAREGRWFQEWCELWATELLRVLKPGGHLISFSAPRTYHRMATAFEDAGFEIRDQIMWVFGSGFPKSLNIGKAIDKIEPRLNMFDDFAEYLKQNIQNYKGSKSELTNLFPSKNGNKTGCIWNWENGKAVPTKEQYGILKSVLNLSDEFDELIDRIENEREIIGKDGRTANSSLFPHTINKEWDLTKGNSEWEGWGTALKPAHEPIVLARKPLSEKSIAENVLKHGTGGINIDGSRIELNGDNTSRKQTDTKVEIYGWANHKGKIGSMDDKWMEGRFPANIIFDEEAGKLLDEQSGNKTGARGLVKGTEPSHTKKNKIYGDYSMVEGKYAKPKDDLGGASRFFYCPKTSKKDRNEGLDVDKQKNPRPIGVAFNNESDLFQQTTGNNHPTVKPTDLMRYLINLVTPKGGTTLDPFMGSGSTGKAAVQCGVNFIGIEKEEEYMKIAEARIEHERNKPRQQELF